MSKRIILLYYYFVPIIIFTACQSAVPLPTAIPTAVLPTTPLPTTTTATPKPPPTHLPALQLPTVDPPTITIERSPTPLPRLALAIPPALSDIISSNLTNHTAAWEWHIITATDPAQALALGGAQLALVEGGDGRLIHQDPIILAVPFTTDWESISLEEAQTVLNQGHSMVTITSWDALSPSKKALRINGHHPTDADYPLQRRWTLLAADSVEIPIDTLATHLTVNWPRVPVIHLAAVGDVMLDRSLGLALARGELDYPFNGVVEQLRRADITVGNVESALGDRGQPAAKSYTFRAPSQAAEALALAGFDIVSLANNHGLDYGPEALLQGMQLLREVQVEPVGAGAHLAAARTAVIREVNGLRLAFLGYVNVPVEVSGFDTESWTATSSSSGLAWGRPEWIVEDVTAVSSQADLIIVILHSGYEYIETPSPAQVAAAEAAIAAGADLVLGHHAHILQGIAFQESGVIVYGLGNFAFEIDGPPETIILNVWLDSGGVRQLELIPAIIRFGGQPRLAETWEAWPIRQTVYRLTDRLNQVVGNANE